MYLELIYFSTMTARILIQVYIEISSYICIADYLKISDPPDPQIDPQILSGNIFPVIFFFFLIFVFLCLLPWQPYILILKMLWKDVPAIILECKVF